MPVVIHTSLDLIRNSKWDNFVNDHPNGWICHLSKWHELINKSFPHIKGYNITLTDNDGKILAGLPLYFVKSFITGKRLVSIPFATLSDPLYAEESHLNILTDSAIGLYSNLNASLLEIRGFKTHGFDKYKQFSASNFYKHHFINLNNSLEIIEKNFHRTCVRQRISRSLNNNIKLIKGIDENDLKKFYKVYLITRKRTQLPPFPYSFFLNLWDIFGSTEMISLLLAEYNNKIIAGIILFKYKDRISAEIAASNHNYKNISPNHFLFWNAIKIAHQEGRTIFDFGRTSPNNTNLMDFKRHWGTEVMSLPQYYYQNRLDKKVISNENSKAYNLVKQASKLIPRILYPLYGKFCYRHLG